VGEEDKAADPVPHSTDAPVAREGERLYPTLVPVVPAKLDRDSLAEVPVPTGAVASELEVVERVDPEIREALQQALLVDPASVTT